MKNKYPKINGLFVYLHSFLNKDNKSFEMLIFE